MPSRLRRWARWCAVATAAILSVAVIAWNVGVRSLEWDRSTARAKYHLQGLLDDGNIPGLAVSVVRNGHIVWSEAIGFADVERQQRATRRTRFRIQSLSKTLTASTMMRLHEAGAIDLDAPVRAYVPSFPDKGAAITIRQLASHRSGIRGYHDDREALTTWRCDSALEAVAAFQDDPLVFAPDTDSTYSNYGYVLLGAALERAGGQPFPAVVRAQVLDPLQMGDTVEFRTGRQDAHDSAAYDFVTPYSLDGSRVASPAIDFTCKWPSGGFLSTADDLARFAAVHGFDASNRFLRSESLRVQFQPRTPPGSPVGVALGWLVARDWRLRRVAFNFGAGSGGRAFLAVYPDHAVAVAIVANLGHARLDMRRLVGITVPFLEPMRSPWPEVGGAAVVAFWIWFVLCRRH